MDTERLEEEIRQMAKDNILSEFAITKYREAITVHVKNPLIPLAVRRDMEYDVERIEDFIKGGHESLRGLKDMAGNPIQV